MKFIIAFIIGAILSGILRAYYKDSKCECGGHWIPWDDKKDYCDRCGRTK
jgi:hypothetical protein